MFIKEIQVKRENLALSRPYSIAFKTVTSVENVIVQIITEDGTVGLGAGNPSKEVVGESLDDTLTALSPANVEWMIGKDIRHFHQLSNEIIDKYGHQPAACAAMDIGLHDLFTKTMDVSLVDFLGQRMAALPTSITIGIKGVRETLEEAKEYMDRGFKILKVKLGDNIENDIERLVKLRETAGHSVLIRIDANQAYNYEQLLKFYSETKALNIELIEQPMPAYAIDEMKKLPEEVRTEIAADESLLGPKEAFLLASPPKACGIFNIKLMKCGGIAQARKISTIAEQANIDLMWGCNDESIISISAALHAAFSCRLTKYIDLDGSLDLARDVVEGGFIIKDGMMSVAGGPGLGLKLL